MSANKQLFVLRHAKSSWDDPALQDHERPLAPRGRRAVELLANHVQANGIEPDLVLCSSSRRTRETLEGVAPVGERSIEQELYSANTEDWIERLRRVPDSVDSVMVLGHNPALQALILRLSADDEPTEDGRSYLDEVEGKFPTGALATLTIDCSWRDVGPGCARLAAYVRPKQLGRT